MANEIIVKRHLKRRVKYQMLIGSLMDVMHTVVLVQSVYEFLSKTN